MKTCTKCGETKLKSDFSKMPSSKDGLYPSCKMCRSKSRKESYEKNPKPHKERSLAFYYANKEKISEYHAKRYSDNPEKKKMSSSKWRSENKEEANRRSAEYRLANPEKTSALVTRWHRSHPNEMRIYRQNRRARVRQNGGKLSQEIASKLLKLQGGKCACCGLPLGSDYHLDHIMPLALGGSNTDDNIQLLRSTCNLQKHTKHPVDFMQQRGFLL